MFQGVIDAMEEGCVPYSTAVFRLRLYFVAFLPPASGASRRKTTNNIYVSGGE